MQPDPRIEVVAGDRAASWAAHHAAIAAITLSPAVPEPIAIQFETARNLYLYAWYVYRFYMTAQVQALTTLELGLRERLPEKLPKPYQKPGRKPPMLSGMLSYAIDQGLIRNEGFRRWHQIADQKARDRQSFERIQRMVSQGLDCMEYDPQAPVEIKPEDQTWDWVAILRESLPQVRNQLAHGSTALTSQVLGKIECVAEILGQLWPAPAKSESRRE